MRFHRLFACLALAVLLPFTAGAADKRPLTPRDLWSIKRLGSPVLSPDGKRVVFTVQEWSIEKNKSTSNLWVVDVAGGTPRRLTTADASDGSPAWSPDGKRIALVSKRAGDESGALYVLPVDGGEAEKILELPYSVANPHWLPDGSAIVAATTVIPELAGALGRNDLEAMRKEMKRRQNSKMTARVTEDRQYRYFDKYLTDNLANRLVLVDVATKEVRDLTPKFDRLFNNSGSINFDVSPDGKTIAVSINTTPRPFREYLNQDIYLLAMDGRGTLRNVTADNRADDDNPLFAPDGRSLLFNRTHTPYYGGEFPKIWRHDLATGKNTPVTEALDYAFESVKFSADGKGLWLTGEDKGVVPVFKAGTDGQGLTPVYKEGTSTALDVRGSSIVFLNDTTSRPNELFALDPASGAVRALTHFNDAFMAQFDLGKVESYWFGGAKGEQIHGWLVYPPSYDASKKYPLVQLLHGGPHTMNRDSWSYRWNTHLFAAPGYIVTWVNRHGSTGFGETFSTSIVNQWGDMPFEDIMKSTDYLLKRFPNIDPKRLAAAGASYGGYMAAWILGHTDRYRCIIDHAGVNDSYAQYATDVPHGFPEVMGGKAWENLEGMQRENPMFYAKNFKTPTLILHGEIDYRVPYGNGLVLYGVLQAMNVPSRLVVFPNENHWVLSPQNAIYWHWEMQNWLSRYIGGKPVLEKPEFDEGAPKPAGQAPASAQAQAAPIDPALLALPKRRETQAVIDTCREKGRQADTRHTLMVFRAALEVLKIKQAYPEISAADPMTSEVAVMLHDIGGGGLAGAQPGAVIAREVLTALKGREHFSDEFVAKVARIVETHHVTGTLKGKDDNPEWFVVLLADTPKIYNAATGDGEAFAKLVQERIDQLKAAIQ